MVSLLYAGSGQVLLAITDLSLLMFISFSSVHLWLPGSLVLHSTHFTGIKGEACGEAETKLWNVSVITVREDGGRKRA